jgi:hypothetical protein
VQLVASQRTVRAHSRPRHTQRGRYTPVHPREGRCLSCGVQSCRNCGIWGGVAQATADMRERHSYNAMVGAGTYIFALDGDRNVDATRTGNIAHLLNHSCAPNCFTRIVAAAGESRVVIFALRDLAVRASRPSLLYAELGSVCSEVLLSHPLDVCFLEKAFQ